MLNVLVDTERMRHRPSTPSLRFEVLERTNHVRIIGGRQYQDAIARRLSDGQLRVIGLPL